MAKKNSPQLTATSKRIAPVSLERILLTLSLVPLVGGVLLIAAWSLDITLVGTLEAQIYVGILMILVSFSLANFVQRRWLLGAGWLLLVLSDWLFLTRLDLRVQGIAIVVGVTGVALLLFEFIRRLRQQGQNSA
jgi:hypothetical protein